MSDDDNDDKLLDLERPGLSPNGTVADSKISRLQSQVNEVVDDMKINIEKVVERGQNLNDLSDRTEQLGLNADLFSKRARGIRKSMWLRTCRARLYLSLTIGVIVVLILCRIFSLFYK